MTHVGKRSVVIGGHKTSIILDDQTFWILKRIAAEKCLAFYELATEIDKAKKPDTYLSEALRLYALDWLAAQVKTTGGIMLRNLLKNSGGTENGFLLASMNWALNKAGIVVEAPRGTV